MIRRQSFTARFDAVVVVVVTGTAMRSTIHTTTTTTTTDIIRFPIGRFDLLYEFVDIPPGPRGRDGRRICSTSVRRSDHVGGG